ncbi:unnamed protein product [Rhodiola kirilowii]
MAMMMDVEDDDVFFADLYRQISLLITDDEDEHVYYSPPISSYPTAAVSIRAFSRTAIYPPSQPQYQFDQTSIYKTTTPDQSKGTGVFIPKSSQFCRSRRTKHQTKASNNYYNNYSSYNSSSSSHKSSYRQQQQLPSRAVFAQFMTPNNC